jgi:hypothetical protein
LVDAYHAFGGTEIDGAQCIADEQAGGVFLGVVNGVFEVEDDGVGAVQPGVDEILRLVAGQVEA